MTDPLPPIVIPGELLPADGRFGSGPTRVRVSALESLASTGAAYMGTSHRQSTVRDVVGRLRTGLSNLFALPDGYEVLLGNGGATAFWDAAVFGLISSKSQHLQFGEFSSKFGAAVAKAPHLDPPDIIESAPGTHPEPVGRDDVDLYALTHNETSTGVTMRLRRPGPGIVAVDATSAAGGIPVDPEDFDVYYFSPQKAFGSDGGLWVAACSPAGVGRIEAIASSGRYIPPSLDLSIALANGRKNQTYNTPALATIHLLLDTVEWINEQGGLAWSAGRCAANAAIVYGWAEARSYATPFVSDPTLRSPVTATIDLEDGIPYTTVSAILRAHGIIDIDGYRKLGRNQLRIGMWPTVPADDLEALTACIDYVVDRL